MTTERTKKVYSANEVEFKVTCPNCGNTYWIPGLDIEFMLLNNCRSFCRICGISEVTRSESGTILLKNPEITGPTSELPQ